MSKEDDVNQAETLVEIGKIEKSISKKHNELLELVKKSNEESENAGSLAAETKSAIDGVSGELNELSERIQEIEQKGIQRIDQSEPAFDIGAEFVKSEQFEALQNGRQGVARMEMKTAIINATGASQPLVPADRLGGINATPNRMLTIRDVLPSSATDSNLVEFARENVFTNNAGPQVGGSPEAFENTIKPESGITFTLASEAVQTLAHWLPASKQVISDSAQLQSYIGGRLTYGLKLEEEDQLLNGTGANGNLNGLITQATAFALRSPQLTNDLDIIRDAIRQAHASEYMPDTLVVNPTDWYNIEILKVGSSATDIRYVIGNPRELMGPTLWGLPVIVTNSIAAGTFLLGSFALGAEIKDRQQATIEVSRENSTNFVDNMITILAEERIALVVYRTEAFITGSF